MKLVAHGPSTSQGEKHAVKGGNPRQVHGHERFAARGKQEMHASQGQHEETKWVPNPNWNHIQSHNLNWIRIGSIQIFL